MSGNAATQPVTGNDSSGRNLDKLMDQGVNELSEKSIPQPPPEPKSITDQPSPRLGSKRSLINRSRQGSRSSRRSARNVNKGLESKEDGSTIPQSSTRPERKQKSGGFLSFLNCCRGDEDDDTLKSDEPDVPAKHRKIEPTPQRAAIPDESHEPISEKTRPQETEKVEPITVQDKPLPVQSETTSRKEETIIAPVVASTIQPDTQAESSTVHDTVTKAPEPESKQQLEFPPPPREIQRESDVDMTDVPIIPPVEEQNRLDEPIQPHDVQPVTLPPPPPLSKRVAATTAPETVPPVPAIDESKERWLLPPAQPPLKGRKCLILDLDETLVHSSFKILNQADFTIPVEIEGQYHNVYVIKRPGVDQFMKRVGELYEVVVFTASVSKYGDPLLDQLDIHHVVHHRLFRESCYNHQGNYVKVCL